MREGLTAVRAVRPGITEITLGAPAARECAELVDEVHQRYGAADAPEFLRRAAGYAARLPAGLRDAAHQLRYLETAAALVVRGGPVGGADCPTPPHWQRRDPAATARHDFWLALVTAQFGDPVAWSSLQDGRLFNDVLPIAGQEFKQTGHGSQAGLELHVEDCFSDERCDALALLCLRNEDGVPNTLATAADLDLAALDVATLAAPRFLIRPDSEHLRRAGGAAADGTANGTTGGTTGGVAGSAGRRRPLLFGSPEAPYLRVDLPYTEPVPGDAQAEKALAELAAQLMRGAHAVTLSAGDLLLVDNYRALHGRGRFQPRYDGTDRWMRKLTVVRDLRRSRGFRDGPDDRVIDTFAALAG